MSDTESDQSILDTIGLLYIVLGCLGCLFSLFPVIHIAMFFVLQPELEKADHIPQFLPVLFIVVPVVMIVIGEAISIIMITLGTKMRALRSYRFVFAASVISLFFFPFGTVLGILSIVYLQKPANRCLFA